MILLDPSSRPIVAHRGASGEFPENTILAFEQGLAKGADALEFDVRLSADGVPVVIHDPTLDRTTNASGKVGDFTARELAAVDAGSGQGIPTAGQVLESFGETSLLIEVKEAAAAVPLAELIVRHGATGRVVVGSFIHTALRCFRRYSIHRCASQRETAIFWAGSRFELALGSSSYAALSVPVRHRGMDLVDMSFVRTARRKGMPVHVWTIDDPAEARSLRELGIAGIITNWPDRMAGLERS